MGLLLKTDYKIEYKKIIKDTVEKNLLSIYKYTKNNNIINPQIRYGYFKCRKQDNSIILFDKKGKKIYTLSFPLSKRVPSYNIADFIYSGADTFDILPLQIVTFGKAHANYCSLLLSENKYKDYFTTAYVFFTALTEAYS